MQTAILSGSNAVPVNVYVSVPGDATKIYTADTYSDTLTVAVVPN